MQYSALVFDLDGTLVDSSNGVLLSLQFAFQEAKLDPTLPLSPDLIGPPLRETLGLLSGSSDPELIDQLATAFKAHYDANGYQKTTPFSGVEQMLQALVNAEIPLHIATNKRKLPTFQIIEMLGWSALFDMVLSPDSASPALSSKAAILTKLLAQANLQAKDCLYIGDRLDDYNAALEIGIPFALAEWGFEGDGSDFPPNIMRIKFPDAGQLISSFIERDCL